MTTNEARKKYIGFFKKAPRSHQEISPAPLVPESDPTTLFTPFGMQQLVPHLLGKPHPQGKRLVNSQPCLRLEDIDEVGNNRHTTFFEMLGNWSLGDYFKKEQLAWIWEFLVQELKLPKDKLYVTVFSGTKDVPRDEKSAEIYKKLGVPEKRIFYYGVEENWWSRTGIPSQMPSGEIGGPDSEIFYEFTQVKHDSKFGKKCHPNCQCGRFLEIGNSVFIQYKKKKDGSLEELAQKNVDFGGGLERTVAAVNNEPDIFETDVFVGAKKKIEGSILRDSKDSSRSIRIILDHIRAAIFLVNAGIEPSNKKQGYILRRLIRRSSIQAKSLNIDLEKGLLSEVINEFKKRYPDGYLTRPDIAKVIISETERFEKTLASSPVKKEIQLLQKGSVISGQRAFDYYQTYGWPLELTQEYAKEQGVGIDVKGFEKERKKHKEKSRTASSGMFKGGLTDTSEETKKLHTATHLLQAALRKVLGKHVEQKGSHITPERLRFDFSHPKKLTDEEIKKVEDLVNEQIGKNLEVSSETMTLEQAKKQGALAFFGQKYEEKVKVYSIGPPAGGWFSKEICGGPHVRRLGELGRVKIIKEKAVASGIRRIYARVLLVSTNRA